LRDAWSGKVVDRGDEIVEGRSEGKFICFVKGIGSGLFLFSSNLEIQV
jgi:hypothetical protein